MNNNTVLDIKKLEKDYKNLVLEMTKLQIQQRRILVDYAKKLNDIKLKKIRERL